MEAAKALSLQSPLKTEKYGVKGTDNSHRIPSKHKYAIPKYFQMFVLRPDVDIRSDLPSQPLTVLSVTKYIYCNRTN